MDKSKYPNIAAVIVGLLTVIFAFLPWASASLGPVSISEAGTSGDGIITLIMGIFAMGGAALAMVRRRFGWGVVIVMGAIVALVGIIDLAEVGGTEGVSVGAGLVLTFICGLALIAISVWALWFWKQPEDEFAWTES